VAMILQMKGSWSANLTFEAYNLAKLRWLKTVSTTFQDVDFDGSLLQLFIN